MAWRFTANMWRNWGGEATRWRFDAVQDGNVVRSVTLCPSAKLHLEVKVSRTTLQEKDTYDMAAVRVHILDENGTPAPTHSSQCSLRWRAAPPLWGRRPPWQKAA